MGTHTWMQLVLLDLPKTPLHVTGLCLNDAWVKIWLKVCKTLESP